MSTCTNSRFQKRNETPAIICICQWHIHIRIPGWVMTVLLPNVSFYRRSFYQREAWETSLIRKARINFASSRVIGAGGVAVFTCQLRGYFSDGCYKGYPHETRITFAAPLSHGRQRWEKTHATRQNCGSSSCLHRWTDGANGGRIPSIPARTSAAILPNECSTSKHRHQSFSGQYDVTICCCIAWCVFRWLRGFMYVHDRRLSLRKCNSYKTATTNWTICSYAINTQHNNESCCRLLYMLCNKLLLRTL